MKKLILIGIMFLIPSFIFSQNSATYDIVFTSNWEAHGTLPNNAHFTELVGVTHNSNITFLELGGLSTPGVEQVAETGVFSIFRDEVNTQITTSNADQFIQGPSLFFNGALRTITISDLSVSSDYPLVSLVSMIAPSPDWMIAVNSVSLIDNGGQWISEITMDLFAYDAGTEEGTGYSLSNPDTDPHEPISMLTSANSPLNSQKIGTIVFTQKSLSVTSFDDDKNGFIMAPNPSNGQITIKKGSVSSISEIEIFNMSGKKVKSYVFDTSNDQYNLDISGIGSGIYLVKAYSTQGTIDTKKLILR